MSIVVTAPKEYYGVYRSRWPSIFLAGGITGCDRWQDELIEKLLNVNAVIYNPRRANFPIDDPGAAEVQISWEFYHLATAHIVSFWFAHGTDNPIVLYELGMWGNSRDNRPIVVGIEGNYSRKQDVIIQTALARPEIPIYDSLDEMVSQLKFLVDQVF
jgi:hypothetical protein